MSQTDLLSKGAALGDRYEVVNVLGHGAMGAVYLANDRRLTGRKCAIKENRPDPSLGPQVLAQLREQFLSEANVLAQLDHPGLPKVSDYFIEKEREYLVMDYVEGEDLDSILQHKGEPLDEKSVVNWGLQVLDALDYLHSQKPKPIIHRDIKPPNIRRTLRDRVKLVDFGLVKLFDAASPETKVELRGIGTPAYAPLEQFAGSEKHTDARSDLYALGATMYHLLTNAYPPDVHQRVLNPKVLTPPSQLNPDISMNTERVVLKAVSIHPSERYQSAEEMRKALETGNSVPAAAAAPSFLDEGKSNRRPMMIFGAVIGVLLLGVLLWTAFLFLSAEDNPEEPTTVAGQAVETSPTSSDPVLGFVDAPTDTPAPELPTSTPTDTPPPPTPTDTPMPTEEPAAVVEATPTVAQTNLDDLTGTIAYATFNGKDYDLYFGQVDGSGTRLFLAQASQPAFSKDGTRIALHSWRLDNWGLLTMDISGGNGFLVAHFVEDQLPTWTVDGEEIIFLSRREGDRKSRLIKVGSRQENSEGIVLGEGEYPSLGFTNQLVFKGWGLTGRGIRLANSSLGNVQAVTGEDNDTAPHLSPDGTQITFMSSREGNWDIYVSNIDGSNLQRLTDNPARDGLPTWSPDGNAIAFVSEREEGWAIWATTPDGSEKRELFSMGGSPDGFVGTSRDASRGWTEERISWTQ